jgi:magnesium transporter
MYLLTDRLYYQEAMDINLEQQQIIFTQISNPIINTWLQKHNFPESFLEDIHNEDQSITFEQSKHFKLIILKYFIRDEEDELLYQDDNVALIISENKFIFLSRNEHIIKNVVHHLYKRYEEGDSLEYVTYSVIDIMVDHTMGVVDKLDDKLEAIEDEIFSEEIDEKEIQKHLYFARRTLNRIAKLSIQSNDAVNKIYNHFPLAVRQKLKYEFIDLKEHLAFLINESKTYLDRTGYLQNLLMGFLSNRMNQAMQRLAAISLIFLPLTFIVGNYGMNFSNMPELNWKYGYFIIWGLNIAIAWFIFKWLKKQKWI